jgi:hypothetical protein
MQDSAVRYVEDAMAPEIEVNVDPALDLVFVRLAGFFGPDDVARFVKVRNEAHYRLRCEQNQHLTLADIRDIKVQAQDIVALFGTVLSSPAHQSRKLAFVTASTLSRSQVRRAAEGRGARFFPDERSARDWLFEH